MTHSVYRNRKVSIKYYHASVWFKLLIGKFDSYKTEGP